MPGLLEREYDSDSDIDDDESMPDLSEREYDSLDNCIDDSQAPELYSIAALVRGQPTKKPKVEHLRPLAFVRMNTRLGKPKPVTIRALIDSGAGGTEGDAKSVRVRT